MRGMAGWPDPLGRVSFTFWTGRLSIWLRPALQEIRDDMAIPLAGDYGFVGDLGLFAGAGGGAGDDCLRVAPWAAGILRGGGAGRGGDGAAVSPAACERGRSWGFDGHGIWVDRGCKAEFRLAAYSGHGPVWWNSAGRSRGILAMGLVSTAMRGFAEIIFA